MTVTVDSSAIVVTIAGGFSIGIMFAACIARCITDSFDVDVAFDAVVFGAISLTRAVVSILDGLQTGMVKWPCPGSEVGLLTVGAPVFTKRG